MAWKRLILFLFIFSVSAEASELKINKVTDLDGNEFYDLTGSYGVNVFGYDFYKECVDKGIKKTRELGPVLGAYHPLVADNILRLKEISGMDEVSFHMSGTEAVMQAVRLARYHTGKQKLVRFCDDRKRAGWVSMSLWGTVSWCSHLRHSCHRNSYKKGTS